MIYSFSTTSCILQDVTLSIGVPITHSIWIKANKVATLGFRNPGTSALVSSNINVNTNWQRFVVTATSTAATSRFLIDNRLANGYGTTGLELALFGGQIEQGAFVTSYIPTTSAAVTRSADQLSFPTGGWYNQVAGTAVGTQSYQSSSGTSFPMLWRFDDGTLANRWNAFYNQSANAVGFDGITSAVNQGGNSFASSTSATTTIAARNSLNNMRSAKDGVLGSLDTSWSPPTVTQYLGTTVAPANKWISKFKYYPIGVIDSQLQLLSQ